MPCTKLVLRAARMENVHLEGSDPFFSLPWLEAVLTLPFEGSKGAGAAAGSARTC